jgi:O-antigen/teichoic acid export membrane protein
VLADGGIVFLKQTLLYLPANTIAPFFSILAIVVWTHFLEPADLGRYSLVVAVQEFTFLFLLWWSTYTLRSLGEWSEAERYRRFQRTEGFVLLGVACLQVVIVTILAVTAVDRSASLGLVLASVFFAVSRSLVVYLADRARTSQRIGLFTVLQISWSVFGFGLGLSFVLIFGSSAVWPLLGTAIAQLAAAVYVMLRADVRPFALRPDAEVIRAAARFGLPLLGAALLTWIGMYGNRFIIEFFLGHAAVGQFLAGTELAERGTFFAITLAGSATLPLAIQEMRESGTAAGLRRLKTGSIAVLGLMIPAAVGITVLATPISQVLIGAAYRDVSATLLPIAAWSGVIYGTWCALPAQALILLKRTWLPMAASAATAILTIIFTILLIPRLGTVGAAYARLAALSLPFVAICYICMSRFGMLVPGRELVRMLFCAALMAAALRVIPQPATLLGLAAVIALGAVVYLSAAALLFRNEIRPVAERWRISLAARKT